MAADPLTTQTVDDLLFNDTAFDTDDDPFAEKPVPFIDRDDKATLSPRKRKADDEDIFGKNIDEEIKITKQRKKIPKLDADRLLSNPGIPKIRALLRSADLRKKLRLKGKAHEFTNAARLLTFYQLWLDSLYPRAKFVDALQLVEKAGHSKKMQMYRKSWIDEGKPGYLRPEHVHDALEMQHSALQPDAVTAHQRETETTPTQHLDDDPTSMFFDAVDEDDFAALHDPDDDELDALLAQDSTNPVSPPDKPRDHLDSEGEDDFDALLAAEKSARELKLKSDHDTQDKQHLFVNRNGGGPDRKSLVIPEGTHSEEDIINHQNDFDDDELDLILNNTSSDTQIPTVEEKQTEMVTGLGPIDDGGELEPLLNDTPHIAEPELPDMASVTAPEKPSRSVDAFPGSEEVPELDNVVSSSPIPNVRTDELDDLMDEHDANLQQRKQADNELLEHFMSSSPIPNGESQ